MTVASHPPSVRRILGLSGIATVSAALPAFVTGALSVLMRADLGFDEARLGIAVSLYFVAAAFTSIPAGRLTEHLGPHRGLGIAMALTATALVLITLAADSFLSLAGFLCIAGMGSAISEPAANMALARGIPFGRQGLSFGIKQAAVPLAGVLAGLSVKPIAVTHGWRWVFALAAVLPLAGLTMIRGSDFTPRLSGRRRMRLVDRGLVLFALGCGLGMAAVTSLQTFFVESAVAAGMTPGFAGALLAIGGIAGVATRLVLGWRADRSRSSTVRMVALLLGTGSLGFVLYSFAEFPAVAFAGAAVSFSAGFGWTGLFHLSVVRAYPASPGAASGIASFGGRVGGSVGPVLFGAVASASGFGPAWWIMAFALAMAALAMALGERWAPIPVTG